MARRLFEDYDTDCSNSLNRSEVKVIFRTLFAEVCKQENICETRLNKLFTVADLNSDNQLNFREFIKLVEDFIHPNYLDEL